MAQSYRLSRCSNSYSFLGVKRKCLGAWPASEALPSNSVPLLLGPPNGFLTCRKAGRMLSIIAGGLIEFEGIAS